MMSVGKDEAQTLINETISMLSALLEATNELEKAINDRDINKIQELLTLRDILCASASRNFEKLSRENSEFSDSGSELESYYKEITSITKKILDSQNECARLLELAIGDYCDELSAIRRQLELKHKYGRAGKGDPPFFIDNSI